MIHTPRALRESGACCWRKASADTQIRDGRFPPHGLSAALILNGAKRRDSGHQAGLAGAPQTDPMRRFDLLDTGRDREATFAETRGNDEDAAITAVVATMIEPGVRPSKLRS